MGRFDALERTATANRVPGLRRVSAEEIREVEPAATGLAALHSPETAITDYTAITRALADEVVAAGGEVRLGPVVTAVATPAGRRGAGSRATTRPAVRARRLRRAAGRPGLGRWSTVSADRRSCRSGGSTSA